MKSKKMAGLLFVIFTFGLVSCNQNPSKTNDETPTRGNIKITVDDAYRLLIDTEIFTFESLYHYAHIKPQYKSELDVIDDFMNDSVQNIVCSKELTQNQIDFLKSKQIIVRTTQIAYDAIAFISNKANKDTLLTYNQIKDMLSGKISMWKQIQKKSPLNNIKIVFDNEKSSNVRFVMEKYNLPLKFPDYCAAVNNNEEVVKYVENHPNAIGVISVNWISDKQDSISHSFLSKIKVMAISNELEPDGGDYYQPYQGFVADKSYPFIRKVFYISRETFTGLGSGFASFISGDVGQRIILKSGMVPATMPIRLVQLKNKL